MRVLVVSNPRATAMTTAERDVLTHALGNDAQLRIAETENRGHAAALACRAMRTAPTWWSRSAATAPSTR